jgi:hypothetical protein
MRLTDAAPMRALLCATPATDLRTYDVRSDVRFGTAQGAAAQSNGDISGQKRVRVTATTPGMGHVGTAQIVFGAGTVPGSRTWSPPI